MSPFLPLYVRVCVAAELVDNREEGLEFFRGDSLSELSGSFLCKGAHLVKQHARLIGDGDNMGATVVCVACAYDKALALERIKVTRDGGLFLFRLLSELALRKSARLLKLVEQVPLAVEFVFMRILCEKTIAALERGDGEEAERLLARQRAFLQEHVLTWIDCFAADLRKSAEGGFYAHLATFTEAFAHADVAALDEVLG